MKRILIVVSSTLLFIISGMTQTYTSGLYLTQLDFETGRLSYSTKSATEMNKIRFNEFLDKPFITIKQDGKKIIFFKDDIFAYKNKRNIVRTRHLVSHNFIERGVIWIYYKDLTVQLGKGVRRERKYFYSVSSKDEIIPLTISNLKRSFPQKYAFHNFLEAQFRSDSDLATYNTMEKKFQVNHLLETTVFGTGSTAQ